MAVSWRAISVCASRVHGLELMKRAETLAFRVFDSRLQNSATSGEFAALDRWEDLDVVGICGHRVPKGGEANTALHGSKPWKMSKTIRCTR